MRGAGLRVGHRDAGEEAGERGLAARGAARMTVVDGTGRFLVPGLIDGHVHLAVVPGMEETASARHQELVESYFRQLPRSYLYFGFTAVVDLDVGDRRRLDELRGARSGR